MNPKQDIFEELEAFLKERGWSLNAISTDERTTLTPSYDYDCYTPGRITRTMNISFVGRFRPDSPHKPKDEHSLRDKQYIQRVIDLLEKMKFSV